MAWYSGTYKCGHEGRVNITGPLKYREYKKEQRFDRLCPECYKPIREAEINKINDEAEYKAEEYGLPVLTGTEKQIRWATTIRNNIIEKAEALLCERNLGQDCRFDDIREIKGMPKKTREFHEYVEEVFDYIMMNETRADYWIFNRVFDLEFMISRSYEDYDNFVKDEEEKEILLDLVENYDWAVSPENVEHAGFVNITGDDKTLIVKYEKNDEFWKIVKRAKLEWDADIRAYKRELTEYTGCFKDRAAEIGSELLLAGFSIIIENEEIRQNAVNGTYEKECTNWIRYSNNDKLFYISWKGMNTEYYASARRIKNSKWNPQTSEVVVGIEHYVEVMEFAEFKNFKLSKNALAAIDRYIKELENVERAVPKAAPTIEEKNKLEEMLKSSTSVINDLLEE